MKERVNVICICGKEFKVLQNRIDAGRGKFCSIECRRKYCDRKKKGTKSVFKNGNKAWFSKDSKSWNDGTVGVMKANVTSFKKGERVSIKTEFKKGETVGENNIKWKGDGVGYHALHRWVQRQLGKAIICSNCGSDYCVEWANKSWEYKRDISDWISLCKKCHGEYDKQNWGAGTRKFKKI